MTDAPNIRLAGLALALLAVIALAGCTSLGSTNGLSDRQHAETTAELTANGTLTVTLTDAHNASKVEISTVDGYPVDDPRTEELVETLTADDLTAGTQSEAIPFDANTTVVVRSYVGDSDIRTTNVYRLHADGDRAADLHGNYTIHDTSVNPRANFLIEPVSVDGNNTTYRVVWTHASLTGANNPATPHGITRADHLSVSLNGGQYSSSYSDDDPRLTTIGDSHRVTVNRSTDDVKVTVVGSYNGQESVLGAVRLPEDVEACGLDDEQFNTDGREFDLPHCPLGE